MKPSLPVLSGAMRVALPSFFAVFFFFSIAFRPGPLLPTRFYPWGGAADGVRVLTPTAGAMVGRGGGAGDARALPVQLDPVRPCTPSYTGRELMDRDLGNTGRNGTALVYRIIIVFGARDGKTSWALRSGQQTCFGYSGWRSMTDLGTERV